MHMHIVLLAQHLKKMLKATGSNKLLNIMGHLAVRQGERAIRLRGF